MSTNGKPVSPETDVITSGLETRAMNGTQRRAVAFKVTHVLLTLFFLWLSFIHVVGLLLFAKGFLLTRLVLEDQSACDVLPDGTPSLQSSTEGCWHPKTFDRAVVVIIDALRYDFTVPFQATDQDAFPKQYHNNLPFMYNTAVQHPEKSFLLPFIADPPTSTLQRLKALTAGNLPTFIDIGTNFAGAAAEEDNILVQLKNLNKTIVQLGDDTWHSLFPGYFDDKLTHAYDSFNVWDLHTVDNGVIEHIFPILQSPKTPEWDVMFAHFLGVDHAGHWYGPDTPQMTEKLTQMDGVVSQLAESIDERTLLVVMGDHGMDSKGDHGGESDDEVQAALWMYSKGPTFGRLESAHVTPPQTAKERPVQQIDLVSTLSVLLGLPVPFNNLGQPIPEALLSHTPPSRNDIQNLAAANQLVFHQMQRYKSKYQASQEFHESQSVLGLEQQFRTKVAASAKQADFDAINSLFADWHSETIATYRQLWAKFDLTDMLIGVSLLALGLIVTIIAVCTIGADGANEMPRVLRYIGLGTIAGLVVASPGLLQNLSLSQVTSSTGPLSLAAFGGTFGSFLSYIPQISMSKRFSPSTWTYVALFFTVSQAAGFASNSYTIHEDTILTFLLSTFGLFSLASSLRQSSNSDRILGIYHSILFSVLTRASSYSRLCREEQMPGCRSTFYGSESSSTSATWHLLIPFIVALMLPEIIKAFYTGTASYVGSASFWIGFCFRTGLFLSAGYWTFAAADTGSWLSSHISQESWKTAGLILARCVLALAIPVGISTFIWSKPCLDISLQAPTGEIRTQVKILGYANTFGTRYFLLIPVFTLSILLLLPPMGQFALAILTWQVVSLLEILDTNGLTISATSQPIIGPVILAMLGSYHFFKTGHQAVLSSIQWNAAYIPLRTLTYPWSPILILLNNFGPQILCAAAVPLTALWKRPVSKKDGMSSLWSSVLTALLAHIAYHATIQLATTMWAGHLRRHLMLYRVFMPRFLMASGVLIIIDLIVVGVCLGAVRTVGGSVAEVFGY